jgi:hypothetical protein
MCMIIVRECCLSYNRGKSLAHPICCDTCRRLLFQLVEVAACWQKRENRLIWPIVSTSRGHYRKKAQRATRAEQTSKT